jgi:hypothetical protein
LPSRTIACRLLTDAEKQAHALLKDVGKETDAVRKDLTRAMRDDAKRIQNLEAR